MVEANADRILTAMREDLASAAHHILEETDRALLSLSSARAGSAAALDEAEASLLSILQACAFHDIVGQRLSRLAWLLEDQGPGDPLLNGPALQGEGLDQSEIDRLLDRP